MRPWLAARRIGLVLALMLAFPHGVRAEETAEALYTAAVEQEQAARSALASDDSRAAVIASVRRAMQAYEAVVRRYPRSGYCDNALWQAGVLALDVFDLFGEGRDHDAGVRYLEWLTREYPHSPLVKEAPAQLARAGRDSDRLAEITSVKRTRLADGVRITIELDGEVPFHEEWLDGPPRVFVDFASTRAARDLRDRTLRFDDDADLIRQIRFGRHPNNTTRVVLDAQDVNDYSVYPLYDPFTLVIDVFGPHPAVESARLDDTAASPVAHAASREPDRLLPAVATLPPDAPALEPPRPEPLPSEPDLPPPVPPAANGQGGFSIARQLGLGVSRIVIDPGHGGHDPGAQGRGVSEAELVLDVALRLEKLLKKTPDLEVILTRRTDEFIPLQERTAIANREGADLFLSIHANASTNTRASGIETYFLNFATTLSAKAVAARENAASGQAMGELPDFVKSIALNNKLDESRDFAGAIQASLVDRVRGMNKSVKDLGVKQAPFLVLIGASMPSVLAEISFVTNTQEAKLLKTPAYRDRIAEALYNAILKYQMSLGHLRTVAEQ
jgi:N-acetylmuramoyl-L-alanine amidase